MNGILQDVTNNFDKICRTCLVESSQMCSIFKHCLSEIIMACATVNVCVSVVKDI